jgi:hypothetical protein
MLLTVQQSLRLRGASEAAVPGGPPLRVSGVPARRREPLIFTRRSEAQKGTKGMSCRTRARESLASLPPGMQHASADSCQHPPLSAAYP